MGKKTLKCGLDTPRKVHSGLLDQRMNESVRSLVLFDLLALSSVNARMAIITLA
jgi:hypothetical protein